MLLAVSMASTLAFAMQTSDLSKLTRTELLASRGAGAKIKKCSYSCNTYNQYINLCPEADMSNCTVCTKGTTEVEYGSETGTGCSDDKFWTTSKTQTQDCGVKQSGTCNAIGDCVVFTTTENGCNDPKAMVKQGSEP